MEDIVVSEIECAVENFVEDGDMTSVAVRRFKSTTIRGIKVDHPHMSPLWIDRQLEKVWVQQVGAPIEGYIS